MATTRAELEKEHQYRCAFSMSIRASCTCGWMGPAVDTEDAAPFDWIDHFMAERDKMENKNKDL